VKNNYCVALVSDSANLNYAAFLVHQLSNKIDSKTPIFVFTTGVTRKSFGKIFDDLQCKQVQISVRSLEQLKVNSSRHVSKATYLKLFIPGSLPAKFEKCLYIDCDTYLNGYLDEVFKIHFNTQIAAVKKNTNSVHIFNGDQSKYFNAGVLLFNLKLISKTQFMNKARAILRKYPDMPFQDQDVLNIMYKDSWTELPESYNYFPFNFMNSSKCKSEDIKIIHFIGPIKPWSLDSPYSDLWLKWRLEYENFNPNSLLVTKRNKPEYQFLRKISRAKSAQFITRLFPNSLINLVVAIYSKPRS